MDIELLYKMIALMEGTVGAKSDVTCTQFLTVLHALASGGMTQKDLAVRLGLNESTVSRNYKKLGPEGTGCLLKEGKLVCAHPHVKEAISAILTND